MNVKVKLLTSTAKMPTKAHDTDACFDIYADCITEDGGNPNEYTIPPGSWEIIHTGITTEIPEGYYAAVYARSGMGIKRHLRLSNSVGIIDSGYRGEWLVALHNDGTKEQKVYAGDRIAQFAIHEVLPVKLEHIETDLSESERSNGGFGSSGK